MMYNKSMKLNVIIPVYNQEDLVIRALDSIPISNNIKVIVIDDASTDNTLRNIINYSNNSLLNIDILTNDENRGVGYSLNRGLEISFGDYVLLLGSDNYLLPEIKQVIDIAENTNSDLVYFNLRINDGSIFEVNEFTKHDFCGSVKLMKRDFIGNTRNPEKRHAEDLDFYNELLSKNPTEVFTGITAKHYNFPRIGSLTDVAIKSGEIGV